MWHISKLSIILKQEVAMLQSCKSKFIIFYVIGGLCFYFLNEFPSENFVWQINVANLLSRILRQLFINFFWFIILIK